MTQSSKMESIGEQRERELKTILKWIFGIAAVVLIPLALSAMYSNYQKAMDILYASRLSACMKELETVKPDIGAKYLAVSCHADGTLTVVAVGNP